MFNEKEQSLLNAADKLRSSIETLQCSHYYSLIGINNLYFLHLYQYAERVSFEKLKSKTEIDDIVLKKALIESCNDYCVNEKKSAPYSYETKNASFLNNLAQMLNTPFFEKEMDKTHNDPAMTFTKSLWQSYKSNWQKTIQPL